jgi:hypothetical protein
VSGVGRVGRGRETNEVEKSLVGEQVVERDDVPVSYSSQDVRLRRYYQRAVLLRLEPLRYSSPLRRPDHARDSDTVLCDDFGDADQAVDPALYLEAEAATAETALLEDDETAVEGGGEGAKGRG